MASRTLEHGQHPLGRLPAIRAALRRGFGLVADRPLLSVLLTVLGFSFFGPLAALVLVATMLDHEFAHRILMRRLGYLPGPVRIIPFVGASVRAGRPMLRSSDIALVYLAGPLAGVLSAAAASLLARHTLQPELAHQVYTGAAVSIALNLFNLLPIEPLDGGLISRVLPYPALLLFPTGVWLYLFHAHQAVRPMGITILVGATWITVRKLRKWHRYTAALQVRAAGGDLAAQGELRASFEVPLLERILVVAAYLLLIPGAVGLLQVLFAAGGWLY